MFELTSLGARPLQLSLRLLTMLSLLILFSAVAHASDTCAVKLHVTYDDGQALTSTWIELLDSSGKVEIRKMMRGSDLDLCDFGFGRHSLRVGTNECFPVTIENLIVDLKYPIALRVLLPSCNRGEPGGNVCPIYFRIHDSAGMPIPDAMVSVPGVVVTNGPADPQQTDAYGRIQLLLGGSRTVTFSKQGFEDVTSRIDCGKVREIDTELVMRPAAK